MSEAKQGGNKLWKPASKILAYCFLLYLYIIAPHIINQSINQSMNLNLLGNKINYIDPLDLSGQCKLKFEKSTNLLLLDLFVQFDSGVLVATLPNTLVK